MHEKVAFVKSVRLTSTDQHQLLPTNINLSASNARFREFACNS